LQGEKELLLRRQEELRMRRQEEQEEQQQQQNSVALLEKLEQGRIVKIVQRKEGIIRPAGI
jgi:hypothetical protein